MLNFENGQRGGLRIHSRARALELILRCPGGLSTGFVWGEWFHNSVIFSLRNADRDFTRVTSHTRSACDARDDEELRKWSRCWQRDIYALLRERSLATALVELHLRRRLDRAQMELLPGLRVRRATDLMRGLGGRVPRVWHAVLRLLCDGVNFPQARAGCITGCPTQGSLRHYARCEQCQGVGGGCLRNIRAVQYTLLVHALADSV